jgi:hypothetical protein
VLATGADERVTVPVATMFVDADEWDACAHSFGGSSNALLAGLTAHLAERRGQVTVDDSVTLPIPANDRTAGDTRGNAVRYVDIPVDPAPATTNLREIRAAIKQALICQREVPDDEVALMSIVPLLPKRLVRIAGNGTGVVSTHLGAVIPAAARPDGTNADYFALEMRYSGATKAMMHRFGGVQVVGAGRSQGKVFVTAVAYQPGCANSNDVLRQDLSSALKDFALTGTHL